MLEIDATRHIARRGNGAEVVANRAARRVVAVAAHDEHVMARQRSRIMPILSVKDGTDPPLARGPRGHERSDIIASSAAR